VILAGGRGSRMGGADKGWVEFEGTPLVQVAIERFRPQVDELLINANRNVERYAALGYEVIQDPVGDFPGPLAGVLAALRYARHDWVATCPCDSPWLPVDLVGRLTAGCQASGAPAAIARTSSGIHPVFALVQRSETDRLDDYLRRGERRVGEWYRAIGCTEVLFEDEAAFRNLNTPDDLGSG